MGREGRDYWVEQLAEYWESGLTIQEYSELKELPYESEYDEMEGIAWTWQSIDGTMIKAPTAQESVGPNPTDRGKKWNQTTYSCRRAWGPVVNRRNRS